MTRHRLLAALLLGAGALAACSDDDKGRPPPPAASGSGGTDEPAGGSDSGGSAQGEAGSETGVAGSGAEGGAPPGAGGAGAGNGGAPEPGIGGELNEGGYGEILPPVGPSPLCLRGAVWATGTRLALSGAGDELIQSLTPDELSIAWQSGDNFYVADRAQLGDAFGTPLVVAGSEKFQAVSLSADGLLLAAVGKDKVVYAMVRQAGQAFAEESPGEGDFSAFNTAVRGDPTPATQLADAVLSPDGLSFFYSYFRSDSVGATIGESHRAEGSWALAGAHLGVPLDADGSGQRRIPTGIAADSLTLFYRDEIEGDFRATWRVNRDQPFDDAEPVSPAASTVAATPNADCSMLYYSAPGTEGVDLFVSTRQ